MKLVGLALLALLLTSQGASQPDAGARAYPAFWRQVRAAIAAKDMRAIKSLTRFPFVVGFQDDQEHTRRVDAAHFDLYFATELRCRDGGEALTDTILQEKTPQQPHSGHVGVYDYDFSYTSTGWRFTGTSYADTSELSARLHGRC